MKISLQKQVIYYCNAMLGQATTILTPLHIVDFNIINELCSQSSINERRKNCKCEHLTATVTCWFGHFDKRRSVRYHILAIDSMHVWEYKDPEWSQPGCQILFCYQKL